MCYTTAAAEDDDVDDVDDDDDDDGECWMLMCYVSMWPGGRGQWVEMAAAGAVCK